MYCFVCGFYNPEDAPICSNCGTRLITNANPRFGTLEEFDKDNIIAQVFSKFESNFSDLFEELGEMRRKIAALDQDVVVLRTGLLSLVEILSEKGLIQRDKFSHIWENRILSDIQNKEERERFQAYKENILMMFHGRNREGFKQLVQEAESLIDVGELDEGLEMLEKALKKDPQNYRLSFYLGQTFYMRSDLKRARKFFQQTLESHPGDYDANLFLGLVYNDTGEIEEAVEHLNKAVEISSEFYLPFFTLGTIFYFEGNLKLADFFLTMALEREKLPEILFFMALVKKDMNQPKKAEKLLLETIETDPGFEDAYYYLGMVYLELGWSRKAQEMFEEVLQLNPSRLELVRPFEIDDESLSYIKHNEEIMKLLEKCDKFAEKREHHRAIAYCRGLLSVEQGNPLVMVHLAMYLVDSEQLEEAALLAERILSQDVPEGMGLAAYSIRHSALKASGQMEEAVELAHEMMERFTSNYAKTLGYVHLAMDLCELKNLRDAEEYAKTGLKISDRDLRHHALDALAWVNFRKGKLEKAYELLEESLSLSPGNPMALYHLGIVLLSMKRRKEAEQILKKLLELREEGSPFPKHLIMSIRDHLSALKKHGNTDGTDPEPAE